MEPELDMFDQWAKEKSEKSWIVRKIQWIPLWWDQEGRYIHREIARGFTNIWYWLPIIWKDRHWDSHYIFEIMMHKIKAQSKEPENRPGVSDPYCVCHIRGRDDAP